MLCIDLLFAYDRCEANRIWTSIPTGFRLPGIVLFNPVIAPTYPIGKVITFNSSTYIVNTTMPNLYAAIFLKWNV
ncbi:hypothetical protein L3i20_v223670 [Paenibacillus sp. L3-i20]|nr:hypothetical protein L3i20_v223670 [Paenibacillus sp. L3-i20]